jgi:hypothetical protein
VLRRDEELDASADAWLAPDQAGALEVENIWASTPPSLQAHLPPLPIAGVIS